MQLLDANFRLRWHGTSPFRDERTEHRSSHYCYPYCPAWVKRPPNENSTQVFAPGLYIGLGGERMEQTPATRPSLLVRLHGPRDEQAWTEFCAIYAPLIERL